MRNIEDILVITGCENCTVKIEDRDLVVRLDSILPAMGITLITSNESMLTQMRDAGFKQFIMRRTCEY